MSSTIATTAPATFAALPSGKTALLTTFRRNGQAVGTPVGILVNAEGDRAYFVTWSTTGKVKRLARNPAVTLAPSTRQGQPTGPAIPGTARRLEGADREAARQRGGWVGRLWELVYRVVLRADAIYYEVTPGAK
jgi:PPOX class probable F420-dependent enzyme